MKSILYTFIILLLSTSSIINAKPIKQCNDGSMKQRDMDYCAKIRNEQAEQVLKDVLNDVNKFIETKEKKHIISGQKVWRNLMKIDCNIVTTLTQEGRESYMKVQSCRTSHIKQRIENLIPHVCGGYGISCPKYDMYKIYLKSGTYKPSTKKRPFILTEESALEKASQLSYVQSLTKKYPNVIIHIDEGVKSKEYIYIYLGFNEKTHTTRDSSIRVGLDGKVEINKPSEDKWRQVK